MEANGKAARSRRSIRPAEGGAKERAPTAASVGVFLKTRRLCGIQ
jgi:hypothetical protein